MRWSIKKRDQMASRAHQYQRTNAGILYRRNALHWTGSVITIRCFAQPSTGIYSAQQQWKSWPLNHRNSERRPILSNYLHAHWIRPLRWKPIPNSVRRSSLSTLVWPSRVRCTTFRKTTWYHRRTRHSLGPKKFGTASKRGTIRKTQEHGLE